MNPDNSVDIDALVDAIIPPEFMGSNVLRGTAYKKRTVCSPAGVLGRSPETVRFFYHPKADLVEVLYTESSHQSQPTAEIPRIDFAQLQDGIEGLFASAQMPVSSLLVANGTSLKYLFASLEGNVLTVFQELGFAGACRYNGTVQKMPIFAGELLAPITPAHLPDVHFLALFESNYGKDVRENEYNILVRHLQGRGAN